MSSHAISGKPGGGKTLYAVKLIVEELVLGSRTVVTNLPLHVDRINEYLQKEYPHKTVDLFRRLRLIDEDQARCFWTYRPMRDGFGWVRIEQLTKAQWESGKQPDYSKVEDGGVLYVIDEIHNYLNSRSWMTTGQDVLFYMSQHRKFSDDIIWITQAIGNVDKQFKSVTQDYTYLRNLAKERMGKFRLPGIFVRKTYSEPANKTVEAMETGTFKLDVTGLASLYDTAQGVGIHGRAAADTGARKKGFHIIWLVVAICLGAFLFYRYVPPAITRYITKNERKEAREAAEREAAAKPKQTILEKAAAGIVDQHLTPRSTIKNANAWGNVDKSTNSPGEKTWLTGFQKYGGRYTVFLSDGRQFEEGDNRLEFLTPEYVVIQGEIFKWKRL